MRKGFTLIELLVVVIIIGVLAMVGIPQYRKALERAKGAEGFAGLGHTQSGEKIYYTNNETYYTSADPMNATDFQKLDITLTQSSWNFKVVGGVSTFTITATRKAGPCATKTISMTETGTVTDTWKACVDLL